MHSNHIIPPENENRWTAFLNGEAGIPDFPNAGEIENADLTSVWESMGTHFSYTSSNPDRAWLQLQNEITKLDKKRKIRQLNYRILQVAAMLVMALGIGFAAYRLMKIPDKEISIPVAMAVAETEAHPANYTIITFADGSTAKLNASTKIEYPAKFTGATRTVKLTGEAFFEVSRDTLHPFVIETENAAVEVLGTSFNVSAYPHASLVEVNVTTGKVKLTQLVQGKTNAKPAILPAGERGWLRVTDNTIGQVRSLAPNYSSWITRQIVFQRTPLSEAFAVLENTYHVKIRMETPEIGRIPYTANFADLKLDDIVEVIARTHKLKVKRNGNEIVFARRTN